MYKIDTPPPTISGNLHIGHIFGYCQADIKARFERYKGQNLLYPFCFDNNGLPTSKLASKNNIYQIEDIKQFSINKSKDYKDLFDKAGILFSEDTYHTISNNTFEIASKAFEILKGKGIAYKAEEEYLYSEILKTSISQFELDEKGNIEKTGEIPTIKRGFGWFINMIDFKKEILESIEKINWKPLHFKQILIDWVDNLKWNWSISRERAYGVNIPNESNLVFDTWFISALSPALASNCLEYETFDMRFQGHDIIRSWALYSIILSMFLRNDIPWKTLLITGHVLDGKGSKFSKSSGNATNPLPLIEKYGSIGIRHWCCSTIGQDIKIDESSMKMGWRILNKFNNAKIFVSKQIEENLLGTDDSLLIEYFSKKSKIEKNFEDFDFKEVKENIYELLWNTICDKWIENSKKTSISLTLDFILKDFENLFNIIYY